MKVLICGGRNWADKETIRLWLVQLQTLGYDTVVEGEARGADSIARDEALLLGMEVRPYPANWQKHGRAAGPIRNRQQFDSEHPDLVLAFHSDISKSKGTADMVKYARSKGCSVIVCDKEQDLDGNLV